MPAMIQAAACEDPSAVKAACERAVVKLGPWTSADRTILLGEGMDRDPNIRGLRARLLVEVDIEPMEKETLLAPFFKDQHVVVRADAIRAVCKPEKFVRADVYKLVIPFLGDPDAIIRSVAADSLNSIGKVEVADLESYRPFFASMGPRFITSCCSESVRSANGHRHSLRSWASR